MEFVVLNNRTLCLPRICFRLMLWNAVLLVENHLARLMFLIHLG
jgi:hypothetical protein